MKKTVSMLLIVTLLLSMSAMLSGCGDEKKILGTWTADVDYADAFNLGIRSADGMDEIAKYFEAEEFIVTTTLIFRDDGSYTMTISEEAAEKAIESIEYIMYDGFESILKEQFKQLGLPISLDKYLESMTHSIWDMVAEALTEDVKDELIDEMVNPHTGNYKVADGKIYMTEDVTDAISEEFYDTYELDGDTLTLLECFCQIDEDQKEVQKALYPMVFTRVVEE